jgi:AcrR family transcriptional regulator
VTSPLRDRLVDAGVALTTAEGWSGVTMARLAAEVGVSRQTVYNEVGGKPALATAMISRELDRFLAVVEGAFDDHPTSLVAAIRAAALGVLTFSAGNPLLHAIVSATHGTDTELLPLLTTHSQSLLTTAKQVVLDRLAAYPVALEGERLDTVVDMVVRVVLSHVMQPSGSPQATADEVAWIAERVLA